MTNFATYIDSGNDKAPIAQRGKAKQKRVDLRLVGLGLVVTRDGGIPLLSHAYPGDRPDVTQFPPMIEQLTTRFAAPRRRPGAGRADRWSTTPGRTRPPTTTTGRSHRHRASSARCHPCDHPDLLAIARTRYRTVDTDRFPGLTALRHHRQRSYGVTRRARPDPLPDPARRPVPRLRPDPGQSPANADRAGRQARPRQDPPPPRRGRGRNRHHLQSPAGSAEVLTGTLTGEHPTDLRLTLHHRRHRPQRAGRPACSANGSCSPTATPGPSPTSWPPTAPNPTPSSDSANSKTHTAVSFTPMHHWTDQNIRVHIYTCVLALTDRPPHAPRTPNHAGLHHVRPRTAHRTRRHRRNRPALPLHRRTPQSPPPCSPKPAPNSRNSSKSSASTRWAPPT